jgi:predicted Zn-dependent peptidase
VLQGYGIYKAFYERDVAFRVSNYLSNKGYQTRVFKNGKFWYVYTNPEVPESSKRIVRPTGIDYDTKKYMERFD